MIHFGRYHDVDEILEVAVATLEAWEQARSEVRDMGASELITDRDHTERRDILKKLELFMGRNSLLR